MFHKEEPDELTKLREENEELKTHNKKLQSILSNTYLSFREEDRIKILKDELHDLNQMTSRGERWAEIRQQKREEIAAIQGNADIRQWEPNLK